MRSVRLVLPSKTFILGEYAVLHQGAGLVLTTAPYFEVSKLSGDAGAPDQLVFPEGCPAQLYLAGVSPRMKSGWQFVDPHDGAGGWGRSSAEFLGVYLAVQQQLAWQGQGDGPTMPPAMPSCAVLKTLLSIYQTVAAAPGACSPSGVDVLAQWLGGLAYVDIAQEQVERMIWPFQTVRLACLHTGDKLSTHIHLAKLALPDLQALQVITQSGYQALRQVDLSGFAHAISAYAAGLQALALVAKATQVLLKQLVKLPFVLAAKGCGAMGADVVCVLYQAAEEPAFKLWVAQHPNLNWVATTEQISAGSAFLD